MISPASQANFQDDQWIRDNLEKLVERYAGRFVAVSNQQPFFSFSRKEAEEKALEKHPQIRPAVFRIPQPKDFACAL